MQEAIALADRGYGHTAPNPLVGCVLVKDGRTIGKGWHRQYGDLHAEREALAACTEDPAGATAYVTLEPCCHHGKQPPCTDAFLEAGISRVVVGITDPNPLVCGKGIDILLEHGVEVEIGLMADKIREQNRIFLKYITERRPWVTLKAAMTLDGKIATEAGDSRWVTSPRSRVFVHRLRGGHSGICVGAGTVRADNPMLDCRLSEFKNPVRILPDSLASLSPESRIAQSARDIRTIVMHTDAADPAKLEQLHACGVETLACKDDNGRIDLSDMLERLGALGIDSLLVGHRHRLHPPLRTGLPVTRLSCEEVTYVHGHHRRNGHRPRRHRQLPVHQRGESAGRHGRRRQYRCQWRLPDGHVPR